MNSVKEDSQDLKDEELDAVEIEQLLMGFIQTLAQEASVETRDE